MFFFGSFSLYARHEIIAPIITLLVDWRDKGYLTTNRGGGYNG